MEEGSRRTKDRIFIIELKIDMWIIVFSPYLEIESKVVPLA